MSKQITTRGNCRHSPMAASPANKGASAFAQGVELEFIPYVTKNKVRRESKPPPTSTETAQWLSSTLQTYRNFAWDHYVPSKEYTRYLKTSGCHRNASVHFKKYFSTISKRFGWGCSGKDLQKAWRYAPKDLKAVWNGIFQVNTISKPAKASGGKRQRVETANPSSSDTKNEPIQAWMSVAPPSNSGIYNTPDFSGSWNSVSTLLHHSSAYNDTPAPSQPPTHFGSPPPNVDNLYEGYPRVAQAEAEVRCYLPPPHSQQWTPLVSSGTLFQSGYSSPVSATSPYSTYSGASYFIGTPGSSGYMPSGECLGGSSASSDGCHTVNQAPEFYDPRSVVSNDYFQWASAADTETKDLAGSWDPLSRQNQPYPSPLSRDFNLNLSVPATPQIDVVDHGYPAISQTDESNHELHNSLQSAGGYSLEASLVGLHTNDNRFLPDLGTAFERHNTYARIPFNFPEDSSEGSVQTGSSIEDLLASLNGPVEPYSSFHVEGIEPVLDLAVPMPQGPWPAYEVCPGYLPETDAALGHQAPSNPRYFNEFM